MNDDLKKKLEAMYVSAQNISSNLESLKYQMAVMLGIETGDPLMRKITQYQVRRRAGMQHIVLNLLKRANKPLNPGAIAAVLVADGNASHYKHRSAMMTSLRGILSRLLECKYVRAYKRGHHVYYEYDHDREYDRKKQGSITSVN